MERKKPTGFLKRPLLTHQARRSLIRSPGGQLQIQLGVAPRQVARAAIGPAWTTRLGQTHPTPHLGWVSSA